MENQEENSTIHSNETPQIPVSQQTDIPPTNTQTTQQPITPNVSQPTPVSSQQLSVKNKFSIQLKKYWQIRIIVSTVLTVAVAILGLLLSDKTLIARTCNQANAVSGCAVSSQILQKGLVVIAVLVLGTIILKFSAVKNWLGSLLAVVPVVVLLTLFLFSQNFINYSTLFDFLALIPVVAEIIILFILAYLVQFVSILVFNMANKLHWSISALLGIVVLPVLIVVIPYALDQAGGHKYQAQQTHAVENLPFKLYLPSYAVQNFKISGTILNNADSNTPTNEEIDYLTTIKSNVGDPVNYATSYSIYQFKTPNYYNPPKECGLAMPQADFLTNQNGCTLIGHSTSGCDVYYYAVGTSAYCKIGTTLITLGTDSGITPPPNDEIIKIFDSLKSATGKQIESLNPPANQS